MSNKDLLPVIIARYSEAMRQREKAVLSLAQQQ